MAGESLVRSSATPEMRTDETSQSVGAKAQIFILHSLHQRYPAIITQDSKEYCIKVVKLLLK